MHITIHDLQWAIIERELSVSSVAAFLDRDHIYTKDIIQAIHENTECETDVRKMYSL